MAVPLMEPIGPISIYNLSMANSELILHVLIFLAGLLIVILTLFSALSTFVLPRAVRSRLTIIVFGIVRSVFNLFLHFARTYRGRDAIMAYYAPIALMLLVPTWYGLILLGYSGMYWALGQGSLFSVFHLSGSSLFTLGFDSPTQFLASLLVFSEGMLGLVLVAVLIAYLPTLYSAFSRREQSVNLLAVRAGTPPSALEMLLRFNQNSRPGKISRVLAQLGGLVRRH